MSILPALFSELGSANRFAPASPCKSSGGAGALGRASRDGLNRPNCFCKSRGRRASRPRHLGLSGPGRARPCACHVPPNPQGQPRAIELSPLSCPGVPRARKREFTALHREGENLRLSSDSGGTCKPHVGEQKRL